MSERGRLLMLAVALVLLAPAAWHVAHALPPFGAPASAYGQTINRLVPGLRNVSNMVAAVNFDVRGIDTVGEELMLLAATTLLLFGLYVVLHGTVTPGGGFQGGVIVASGLLLVYLGDGYGSWRRMVPGPVFALLEGGGALAFVGIAALPLAWGMPALANRLPLGTWKDLYSGGTMVAVNLAIGAAVTGSFALLLLEFMEETRAPQDDDMPDEEEG